MKNVLFLIGVSCLGGFVMQAQLIPYNNSLLKTDTTCSFNDTVNLVTVKGWQAYQTFENTYNGTMDSSICVSLKQDTTYAGISFLLSSIDTNRSLYLKALIDSSNWIGLEPNFPYNIYCTLFPALDNLDRSNACSESICSGVILGISTFDEDETLINKRWIIVSVDSLDEIYSNSFCFSSEHMPNQYITDFIYKYTFAEKITADTIFIYGGTSMEMSYGANFYSLEGVYGYSEDSIFVIPSYSLHDTYTPTIIASFDKLGIPSLENSDTIFAAPNPNTDTVVTVELRIEPYDVLQIQPYVQFLGGYIEGDTLRHNFHLVNNGGDFCIYYYELAFTGNSKYIYNSGLLDLNYTRSCMMFGDGGTLEIGKGSTLNYGNNGIGMLALGVNANINLLHNASLVIGNNVRLFGSPEFDPSVYIHLNEGNKFVFAWGSTVRPGDIQSEEMQLCFYMNGGELDDSALSAGDRKYIRRIYPSTSIEFYDKLKIFPNPVSDILFAELESEMEYTAKFEIFDFFGKSVLQNSISVKSGVYQYSIPVNKLQKGIYFIQFEYQGEIMRTKFIRL